MRDPASDAPALRHGALMWGGLAAATVLTILFGLIPTPLLEIVNQAACAIAADPCVAAAAQALP
jgi:hypothetical protein